MDCAVRPGRALKFHQQRGASIIEAVIALPILLVVILGAIQFGLVYEAKATLNHASLQAARLGAVRHADPDAIRRGLARGLVPLYSPDSSLAGVARSVTQINTSLATDARVRILNPTREAFDDFGVDVDGEREIPNERLHARSTAAGAQSGINIQDANLLKVQITYGYELQVPLVNWFIARVLLGVRRGADTFEQQLLRRTRIPIVATATVRMQSTARMSGAVVSLNDLPDLDRIPSDAAPSSTDDEPEEEHEEQEGNGQTPTDDGDEGTDDGSSLDDGFLGFGGGPADGSGGGSTGGGSSGGGSGGGLNDGNPQSCSAGEGNTSPFPIDNGPRGDSSPVPPRPGLPGGFETNQASGANIDAVSLASLSVGNPIHVVTGNKYQVETDIEAMPGTLGLAIQRHYNSAAVGDRSVVGAGWRLSYEARLRDRADGTIEIVQADGRLLTFAFVEKANPYVAQRASDGTVIADESSFRWQWPSGRELHFDPAGRLVRMQEQNVSTVLRYNDQGELVSVRDSQKRELRFEYYANGRLATIRGPAKIGVRYVYSDAGNLGQAIGTDGVSRRYYYDDERHPHHLTGIAVSTVLPLAYGERPELQRVATWAYDEQGRAVFSSHPDEAGKVTLSFAASHTDVTDAFGRVTRYLTDTRDGVAFVSEVHGPGCGKCGQGDAIYTYDERFEPVEVTTKTGGTIRYRRDDEGRIEHVERLVNGKTELVARYVYDGASVRPTRIERPSVNAEAMVTLQLGYTKEGALRTLREDGFAPAGDAYQAISRTTTLTYDQDVRIVRIDGPRSDVDDWADIEYDNLGRVSAIKTPATEKRIVDHDAAGRPTNIAETGRPATRLEYDTHGRVTSVTKLRSRAERRVKYRYDFAGRLEAIIDSSGRTQRYGFDAAGRPNGLTSSDSDVVAGIRYAPDDSIERVGVVGANGQLLRTLYYTYDAERRLTEVRDGDGQPLQQLAYLDADALPERKTDPLGRDTWFAYDAIGQLASVLAPDGGLTRFERSSTGILTTIQAPNDAKTSFVHDDFGRRVEERSADRGTTQYRYDPAGNLIEKRDARGMITHLEYDAANRLVTVKRTEGTSTLSYSNGLLTAVDGENVDERFEYDRDAQLIAHTRVINDRKFKTRFSYDPAGRLETRDLPSGTRLRYRYNNVGALRSITQGRWHGDLLLVQADAKDSDESGSRLQPLGRFAFGNGIGTRTTFDAGSGTLRRRAIDGVATTVYEHDEAGRIRKISKDRSDRVYDYDEEGRLTYANTPQGQFTYEYDKNGNRLSSSIDRQREASTESAAAGKQHSAVAISSPSPAKRGPLLRIHAPAPFARPAHQRDGEGARFSYAASSNRLMSIVGDSSVAYRYDAAGNPLQIGARRYEYDTIGRATRLFENNRLIAEYRYNFWGERVQKIVYANGEPIVTLFIYEQQQLIAEADERGRIIREYVYLDHHPIAVLERGALQWIHTDHLGTPLAVTNINRTVTWRADYDPFGLAAVESDPDRDGKKLTLNLRFPGQYADAESGTHYNYFRDYDPATGRYLTSDPVGIFGGTNAFAYVHGNPMSGIDPLGLYQEDIHYYMMLFLGITAGIDAQIARQIALAAAFVDVNEATRPTDPENLLTLVGSGFYNQSSLALYHFVLTDPQTGKTFPQYRNSNYYTVANQLGPQLSRMLGYATAAPAYRAGSGSHCDDDAIQVQFFGEFLHSFADTYSHRDQADLPYDATSFGYGIGHAVNGYAPDYTFNEEGWASRQTRTFSMELDVRDKLRQSEWAAPANSTSASQFDLLADILRDFNSIVESEEHFQQRGGEDKSELWLRSSKVARLNLGLAELGYEGIDLTSPEFRFDETLARRRRRESFEDLDLDHYRHAILDTP